MIHYPLDTNIISELVQPRPDSRVVERYRARRHESAIASTIWHELLYGVERLPSGKRRDTLAHYMEEVIRSTLPVLPYDAVAAEWHARQRVRLERVGQPRPYADALSAAVAATRGLVFVTRNERDVEGYDGLTVENWFE